MVYRVLLGFAVSFIILGLLLAVITVIMFFKRNMAEVYDSLLGRNYSSKFGNKKPKVKHTQSNTTTNSQPQQNVVRSTPPQRVQGTYNSGNTALLNQQKPNIVYRSGNTTVLNQKQDNTVPHDKKNTSKDFVVTKDITYTYTNEKID